MNSDSAPQTTALLELADRCERRNKRSWIERLVSRRWDGASWHDGNQVLIVDGDAFADHPGGMYPSRPDPSTLP